MIPRRRLAHAQAHADAADEAEQAEEQGEVFEHDASFREEPAPDGAADVFTVGLRSLPRQYQIGRRTISKRYGDQGDT